MLVIKRHSDVRRRARANRTCGWALSLWLPLLLLALTFGGRAALVHTHGDEAGHVHLLITAVEESHEHLSEASHRAHHDDEEPAPAEDTRAGTGGFLVQFPASLAVGPTSERVACKLAVQMLALAPTEIRFVARALDLPPPPAECLDRPRSRRSGIATLLRSSRAILI
jgi:hypothetical protein